MSMNEMFGHFFSTEQNFAGFVYLDMLQNFLNSQIEQDFQEGGIFFQQVGAAPHFHGCRVDGQTERVLCDGHDDPPI
jgi:hypothetical protein